MTESKTSSITLTLEDWLSLSFLSGIGPSRLSRLFTYLNALERPETDRVAQHDMDIHYELLRQLKWPEQTAREAMAYFDYGTLSSEQLLKREQTFAWLEANNHHVILQSDSAYPEALKEIHVAPTFLYLEGDISSLSHPKIGIVGARHCTGYGRDVTKQLAMQLSEAGLSVVSGGAKGIDTAAHLGALESGTTPTIAVMGTGLLHFYPKQNIELFDRIKENNGCVISEYPLTTDVRPHLFPPRNRIISGLSMGVLVTEASPKSGSLISASYAVQQNREVFAVPGRVHDAQAEGCHQLIKQGATLVRHIDDILSELSHFISQKRSKTKAPELIGKQTNVSRETFIKQLNSKELPSHLTAPIEKKLTPLPAALSDNAQSVAKVLEEESLPLDFDALTRRTELNAASMMQSLMELELHQCIENRNGAYVRC